MIVKTIMMILVIGLGHRAIIQDLRCLRVGTGLRVCASLLLLRDNLLQGLSRIEDRKGGEMGVPKVALQSAGELALLCYITINNLDVCDEMLIE